MTHERTEPRSRSPRQTAGGVSPASVPRQPALFTSAAERGDDDARATLVVPPVPSVSPAPAIPQAAHPPTAAPSPVAPSSGAARAAPTPAMASGRPYLTADLRAATGLSRTAMDFYLRAGVVRPSGRTESGYLLFDEAELAILREVLVWRTRGIALKEIKARLGRGDAADRP